MTLSISRVVSSITFEAALVAVQAAIQEGTARGVPVVAAVVDQAGHLVACLRDDGAYVTSIEIARDKAWTAAIYGAETDGLAASLARSRVLLDGIASRPNVVLFGGGLPVVRDGAVIGGIGVSGGTEHDDKEAALAGLAAIGLAP